ncbi:PREDICTED: mannosyl-oligosaccharide glucosidase-like [Priapulus caudatus]|uniref:Mannosyl-oligosaccharide glucosidase n=1 Tax=Priapulus caudatus TaxID=37621 RepID=A0ABM1DNN8_PRICU|nr:PREDICTED: mannosyl-oligosaccharide glucosidase-like [Priapulus caudatus]
MAQKKTMAGEKRARKIQEESQGKGVHRKPVKLHKVDTRDHDDSVFLSRKVIAQLSFIAVLVGIAAFSVYDVHRQSRVITRLSSPTVITQNASSSPARFWGTYRPQAYFGLKTRSPQSPVVGLMWFTQFKSAEEFAIRHWCEQGDRLPRYGWLAHDGVNFGVQEIVDEDYILKTSFVKRTGGSHGGDWTARIVAEPHYRNRRTPEGEPPPKPATVSLLFYIALDNSGWLKPNIESGILTSVEGYTDALGQFMLKFPTNSRNHEVLYNYYLSSTEGLHVLKGAVMRGLKMAPYKKRKQYVALGGNDPRGSAEPNFIVHQVTVPLPHVMEVTYTSGDGGGGSGEREDREPLLGRTYDDELRQHRDEFDERFERVFRLREKGYDAEHVDFAKAALGNLVGGIGFFYGSSLVQSLANAAPVPYWAAPLYTAVPSRSFFPRGFLWDEGFHNLLVSQWDIDVTKDVLGHWLDLMNADGWIPREQILGPEARSKVPDEFVVQRDTNANPPTLFLPLRYLLDRDDERDYEYLRRVYPRLQAWYGWFNVTQRGDAPGAYRWRGRNATTTHELNPKTLTSGIDDAPRASHPTDDERHVDLRCWMALASGVMADVAEAIGEPAAVYRAEYAYLTDNEALDALHWSDEHAAYCDYGLHTDAVKLKRPRAPPAQPGAPPPPRPDLQRSVAQEPRLQFVNSFGYTSLFPFLLQIVRPDSPKLERVLASVRNESLLWTRYGLRSLAKTAPLYMKRNTEHDPPYWRGSIWININFLAVRALNFYANSDGPYRDTAKEMYTELRRNLVENVFREYQLTGYVWEHYNDETGKGEGSHPFTGWSALIVLIMADSY